MTGEDAEELLIPLVAFGAAGHRPATLRDRAGDLAGRQRFEQVAPRPHRADDQAQRSQPPAEAEHVDVEGVAPRRTFGPAGLAQRITADDGPEPPEQRGGEARFDRRQGHPSDRQSISKALTIQNLCCHPLGDR